MELPRELLVATAPEEPSALAVTGTNPPTPGLQQVTALGWHDLLATAPRPMPQTNGAGVAAQCEWQGQSLATPEKS